MFYKSFALAGFILTSLTGVAGAFTLPGFPQVNIVSPNAHIDLLPGAFVTPGSNSQAPVETSNVPSAPTVPVPQNAPSTQSVPTTPGSSAGSDAPLTLAKLVQLPPSILKQISDNSSSSFQTGLGPGSGSGGSQPGISPVPLPPGLPLFGVALIATAVLSRSRKLRFANK